ncbi:MAG TPA: sodium ion-translocating decarboxylase subunit beta [Candidatus Paceibacterota bacterium]|nr:sodium ion-translocating decarboxylase subunit beta [Verrucomicrobiota bacterium]HOX01481.1 sodium ion-translocating decarboxylase subunit beta [Verrucomicrobiota bacterium]HRZ44219.1 sodium ion-translocating decarboxylase subunit beta [Candidatus Paceibacterota bacterium]HRZ92456.1 sodium ion-translocating decarboxylase subunit beta [Candidatus Paceibacterota bacterium]
MLTSWESLSSLFQGVGTLFEVPWPIVAARFGLIFLGFLLIYLGKKGVLEALIMIPMGLGMATVNAAVMFFDPLDLHGGIGNLFVEPQAGATADAVKNAAELMTILQIDWLQPIYTFTFSNGLIACLVFMGIGSLLDIRFILARPLSSMVLALFAELGTIMTLPIATAFGFSLKQSAAISIVGGADGPMVLFTSLQLAPELFVPIAVVAYLYLGLAYGGYPYLIKLMVPERLRGLPMPPARQPRDYTSFQKLAVACVTCVLLSFLLPVAAPLIFSLFFGIVVRESGIKAFQELISGPILYGSTMFLGLMLGVLCDANTIMDPKVLPLLLLGMLSLLLSGIGGILGGYALYFLSGGRVNPVVGIAGVSCVPTTAKVAQKVVSHANPHVVIMPHALGANICGVITTAIIAGVFCSLLGK